MTRNEILELAKQAGCAFNQTMFGRTDYCVMTEFELERFAQLVAASEREAQMTEYGKACYEAGLAENPEPEAVAHSPTWLDIIDKYQRPTQLRAHPPCSRHPDAPHGFDRTASHNADRYVCVCESWAPGESS